MFSACSGGDSSSNTDYEAASLSAAPWVTCAKQGERCTFASTARVRYGVSNATPRDVHEWCAMRRRTVWREAASLSICQFKPSVPPAGVAGSSGSAGQPAAGSGGAGTAAPVAGTGTPTTGVAAMVISSALRLDRTSIQAGDTLTGTVTYTNTSAAAVTIWNITVAARRPGATHVAGPYDDLAPIQDVTTIPARGSITLTAKRTFSALDAVGQWEAFATLQTQDGRWHDGPSTFVGVSKGASCVRESDQAFCARTAKAAARSGC